MRTRGTSEPLRRLKRSVLAIFLAFLFALPAVSLAAPAAPPPPKFVPAINIPTVKFSDAEIYSATGEGNKKQRRLDVPWLAQYVGGVYEYAAGIALVLAGVMVVIGGFQYQTAGGDSNRVGAAKTRITDALIGALLVIGAYVILNTISTDLVAGKSLDITLVEGMTLEPNLVIRPGVEERGGPKSDYKPGPPSPGAEQAVIDGWKKAAGELGVDACVVIGIGDHESGNKVNIWNGKPGGLPREKAVAWGPGQVIHPNFVTGDPKKPKGLSTAIKKRFGDRWPDDILPVEEQKQKKTDVMITDAEVSTWAATFLFKSVGGSRGNELYALASYAAGGGSIASWRKANGCTPQKVSMDEAANIGFEAAMQKACLPIAIVAVPNSGGSSCPGDKGECRNAKVDKTATFVGTCEAGPDAGKKCIGMDTNGFIRYILGRYKAYKEKYNCQ